MIEYLKSCEFGQALQKNVIVLLTITCPLITDFSKSYTSFICDRTIAADIKSTPD